MADTQSPTEKDLERKRSRNETLREQIAEAEAKASNQAQEQSRLIEASQLDAETARLEAQLAAAKQAAKVSVAREGAAGPLDSVTAQLEAAQQPITPPGVTVDTNAASEAETSTQADSNGGNS